MVTANGSGDETVMANLHPSQDPQMLSQGASVDSDDEDVPPLAQVGTPGNLPDPLGGSNVECRAASLSPLTCSWIHLIRFFTHRAHQKIMIVILWMLK